MRFEEFKEAVTAAAGQQGLTDYELYYASSESSEVEAFLHEINSLSSSVEGGACFRCLIDGKMGYASTEDLSAEEAEGIVLRAMENAAALETSEQEFLNEGGKLYQKVNAEPCPLPETEELIARALQGQELLYAADELVTDGSATSMISMKESLAICNSRGLDLSHSVTGAGCVTVPVVKKGEEMNDKFELYVGPFAKMDQEAMVNKAVKEAIEGLGAEPAPTGAYPVIFEAKTMANLLMTFSGSFSAENARKGLSRLQGKEGEKIAAENVTILDDPFYPDNLMQMPFDAEGTPTYTKAVIEKGELKTLLYNLKTAAALGKESTGNASKRSYDAPVEIRPFTLAMQAGALTEEELLAKAGNGVWINSLQGMHAGANPISGDFSLQSNGYLIEDGKKTRAVKAFTVAGNFFDVLKNITALSNEVKLGGFGASVTAFAAPAVLVEGLSVAGK